MIDLGKTLKERERLIHLVMICMSAGILTADVFLPLGFVIRLLHLMPFLISVWLSYLHHLSRQGSSPGPSWESA